MKRERNMVRLLFILFRMHTNIYHRIKSLKNVSITILVQKRGFAEIDDDELDVRFLKMSILSKWIPFPKIRSLRNTIKETDPDIVFIKKPRDLRFYISIITSRLMGKRVILLEQEREVKPFRPHLRFRLFIILLKLLRIRTIIVPTKVSYNTFKRFGLDVHCFPFVFRNSIDEKHKESEKIRLLSVGKFTKRKNQLFLLKAVEKMAGFGNIHLTIVGQEKDPNILRELKDYINEQNLSEIVTILTNVRPEKMENIYRDHDIFILPSYKEPAAFSIVEAFHYGIPVICTSDCGTNCYIENGSNGYIFRSNSEDDLIGSLIKTIDDLENMRENTKKIFLQNHQQYLFHHNLLEKKIL
jgi:glycosyltransferase involved in cell wall biosynthesis